MILDGGSRACWMCVINFDRKPHNWFNRGSTAQTAHYQFVLAAFDGGKVLIK